MKTILTFLALFISCIFQSQTNVWTKQFAGGNPAHNCFCITSDASGNVYNAGFFSDTVDFDPGPGIFNLYANTLTAYVSKFDANGNFIWAANVSPYNGSPENSNSRFGIYTDNNDNVYVNGFFSGTCDFDPGPGTFTLTTNSLTPTQYGALEQFIWKLSPSGNLVWAKHSTPNQWINAITSDATGNIFISGEFKGTCDFSWGAGTNTLSSSGGNKGFIAQLDAAGNISDIKQFGSAGANSTIFNSFIDASFNVNVVGNFSGTIDADPGVGTHILSSAGTQYFTSRLDPSGNFISALAIIPPSGSATIASVSNDIFDNTYVVGKYTGVCDFDPALSVYTLQANSGVFVYKLDPLGNFAWAKSIETSNPNQYLYPSLQSDGGGNIYISGLFSGVIDADPGPGTYTINALVNISSFLCMLNSSGNFVNAFAASFNYMQVDQVGNIYTANSGTASDIIISKYSSVFTGIFTNKKNDLQIGIFPNPGNGEFTLKNDPHFGKGDLEIYNVSGQKIYEQKIDSESTLIDLKDYCSGIYMLRLTDNDNRAWQKKLIKE